MTISIKIIDNLKTIEKNILSSFADELNKRLAKSQRQISLGVTGFIPEWISAQPEIQSLLSNSPNSLVGQFGIVASPASIVNTIIEAVVNSANISITPYDKSLRTGGIQINIQPTDFKNLLGLPDGHTYYAGGDLHWLDWLLTKGDSIIVVGYQYNPQTGLGRSRLGNMKTGGSFRVPPEFSGTNDNNFITRALIGPEQTKQVSNLLKQILEN